jgi:hypothetical protein
MAFMAAWWGIWQMVSGLVLAFFLSRIKLPAEAKATEAKVPVEKA